MVGILLAARVAFQNVATAGVIGTAGDGLMQYMEGTTEVEGFDSDRALRLATYRGLQAPLVHMAWSAFDRVITVAGPSGVAAKVVADQLLIAPPSLTVFFYAQARFEGKGADVARQRLADNFFPTWFAAMKFWGVAHCLTFGVVPPRYRIAWASFASVGWNAYLSNANQTAIRHEKRQHLKV
jgi:hypothetical protein